MKTRFSNRLRTKPGQRNSKKQQFRLEALEDRRLLATDVLLGSVDQFSGPEDLNLDASRVAYAINFSQDQPDVVVNGVTFQHDRQVIPGATFSGPREISPWGTTPDYGNTNDENALELVTRDMRWAAATGEQVQANLDVIPGRTYELQLLISENADYNRRWDITVEGQLAVDEFTSLGASPGQSYSVNRSTVYTYEFIAGDAVLNVAMGGPNFPGSPNDGGDRNALWQGIILNDVTPDFTWDGTGDGSSWSDPLNWQQDSGIPGAGDRVRFANTDVGNVDLGGVARQAERIEFSNGAGTFDLQNGTLAVGGIRQAGEGTNIVSAALEASGSDLKVANDSANGSLNLAGDVDLSVYSLNFVGIGDTLVSGDVSGAVIGGTVPGLGGITSELEIWLDASDINADGTPDALADGTAVTNWQDKSGNGRNFDDLVGPAPSLTLTSTHGESAVNFDGTNALRLNAAHNPRNFIDGNGEFTTISVARYSGADRERIITTSSNHNWLFGFHAGSTNRNGFHDGWGSLDPQPPGPAMDDYWHLHSNRMNVFSEASNPAGDWNRDGVLVSDDSRGTGDAFANNVPDGLSLGAWNGLGESSTAEVSELIMYNRVLSEPELAVVEAYLANKYSLDYVETTFALSNDIVKSGSGTVTLTGNNSYDGETIVSQGVLVAGSDAALGTDARGTTITDGGTLGLSGGITIATETLVVSGAGAVGSAGALVSLADSNEVASPIQSAGTTLNIGSQGAANTLVISSDLNLVFADLIIEGDGNVEITGDIADNAAGINSLANLNSLATGDYTFTTQEGTFEAHVDNDGTNSWLLVGRGREGWQFDIDGQANPEQVIQGLGTPAAFRPAAYSNDAVNDLLSQIDTDMGNVEVRISRTEDAAGTTYQESRWRDFNTTDWTWVFSNPGINNNSGGIPVTREIVSGQGSPQVATNAQTRDFGGNDITRIFTWSWNGHGGQRGFSFGTTVTGGANNEDSFLWESVNENHAIPYTEIYVRLEDLGSVSVVNDIIKQGSGTLTLSGNNTFTGETIVNEGSLVANSDTALGDTAAGTTVNDGGTLGLSGSVSIVGEAISLSGPGAATQPGALVSVSGNNTLDATLTLNNPATVGSVDDTFTIDGDIDLSLYALTFDGDGDILVNGDLSGDISPTAGVPDLGGITSELELWLDATDINADGTPDALADGTAITNWQDKSGNGRNFDDLQGPAPSLTLSSSHGESAVNFDGTNALRMNAAHNPRTFIDGNGEFTLISVARYSGGDRERVIAASSAHNWLFGFHGGSTNQNGHYDGWGSLDPVPPGFVSNDDWHLHSNRMNVYNDVTNPAGDWYRDGVLVTNDSRGTGDTFNNNVPDGLSLGGWNGLTQASTAEVSELIMYNRVLSESELFVVEAYLANKYDMGNVTADTLSNNVVKNGGGTVTLTGNNSYSGATTANAGTLVATTNTALGDATSGTTVADGATLGLSGGVTLAGEAIVIQGTGSTGQPGALVNVSGDNTIDASSSIVAGSPIVSQVGIGSIDGTLTINASVNMGFSSLAVDGAGDVVINGLLESDTNNMAPSLANLDNYSTGDYTFTADGQTFTGHVDSNGTDSWLLIGRGREGWDMDADGDGSFNDVYQNLGVPAGFDPEAYSDAIVNDLLAQAGFDNTDIEVRLHRAANIAGTEYQESRFTDFATTDFTFDFDVGGVGIPVTWEVDDSVLGTGIAPIASNTRDTFMAGVGNNHQRVFTWAWGGHNNQQGFSYGSDIQGVDNNDPNTSLWEFTGEGHAIPYTEVYVRIPSVMEVVPDNQLTKTSTGTLTLTAANTFADGTTVSEGTLLTSNTAGSATGGGNVTVNGTGVLAGTGTVSGDVNVTGGGTISAGNAPGTAATLTTGSLVVSDTGISFGEITSSGNDTVAVIGTVDLTDANGLITLEDDLVPANGATFLLIANDAADDITGTLSDGAGGNLAEGEAFEITHLEGGVSVNRQFTVSYMGGDGNDLELTFINRAPVGNDQTVNAIEDIDHPDTVDITDEDGDADVTAINGNMAAVGTDFALPSGATLNLAADGSFTYSPVAQFSGSDTFTYTVSDGVSSDTATVTVNIAPVADPVTIVLSDIGGADNEASDIPFPISFTSDDTDGSETITSAVITGVPAAAMLSAGTNNGGVWTLSGADLVGLTITQDDGPNPAVVSTLTVDITTTDTDGLTPETTDTATDSGMLDLTIDNDPPAPTLTGPNSAIPGFEIDFTYLANDLSVADRADTFDYTIDWGDGSAPLVLTDAGSTGTASHTFGATGSLTITLFATDKDGETNSVAGTFDIDIVPVAMIGDDIFAGGTDGMSDRIIFYSSNAGVQVRYNNVTYPTDGSSFSVNANTRLLAFGQGGSDQIIVSGNLGAPAVFDGGEGNDYLAGGTSDDTLIGGAGNDVVLGGEGDNVLIGDDREGTVMGGNDRLEGRSGADTILGGDGNDRLNGGSGDDVLDGGDGNDFLFGGLDNDLLYGNSGADTINGSYGNDVILGGDSTDQLFGSNDHDLLLGGNGVDRVRGDSGDDIVAGGTSALDDDIAAALASMLANEDTTLADANSAVDSAVNGWFTGLDESPFGLAGDSMDIDDLTGGSGVDDFYGLNDSIRDLRDGEQAF